MLGRFLQPDTIIPGPANPQAWNRYAYTFGNPIKFNDPSGHSVDCGWSSACTYATAPSASSILKEFNVTIDKDLTEHEQWAIVHGVIRVGSRFAKERNNNESASQAFTAVFNEGININSGVTNALKGCKLVTVGGCTSSKRQINFWSMAGQSNNDMFRMIGNVIHELGHALNYQLGENPVKDMPWYLVLNRNKILQPNSLAPSPNACDECEYYQFNREANSPGETYADMFVAWMSNTWNSNSDNALDVSYAQSWMNQQMGAIK